MQEFHEGVGLLISNSNRSRFYIQLKDATYPIPKWRGACSFWGGAVESEDKNEEAAVWRELREEIPQALNIITTILPIILASYINSKQLYQLVDFYTYSRIGFFGSSIGSVDGLSSIPAGVID